MTVFDGVTINGLHTYKDFQLYKVGEFDWGDPEPKRELVDIPGRDGALDFSTAATGEIKFTNRECVLNFKARVNSDRQPEFMARIKNAFHGAYVEVIDDAEPEWTYRGFATVTFPDKNDWQIYVTINIDAEPYKLANNPTIITVSPSAFNAEDIRLGEGTQNQKPNSIFTFGSSSFPELDLTQFQKLTLWWSEPFQYGTPTMQIVDSDGETFETTVQASIISAGKRGMPLDVASISSIDTTKVYRILVQKIPFAILEGTTLASASVFAPVEKMSVIPMWNSTAQVTALINGRSFILPSGPSQNLDIKLTQGDNQISFIADSEFTTISLQYQDGRL